MATKVSPPLDWKSSKWWANRPVDERLALAGFPKLYRNFDLGTINAGIARLGFDWLESKFAGSPGLLISGKAGTGKTGLAQAIGKEIIRNHKQAVYFVGADKYVEMVKDTFDSDNNELPEMYDMPHLLRYIKDVFHVVVIDSLGRERPTDFSRYEVGALLRRRYEECRPIIVTTSLAISDITNRYGDSASSVLKELDTINVNGIL